MPIMSYVPTSYAAFFLHNPILQWGYHAWWEACRKPPCAVSQACLRLSFNWKVIGAAPLIMNHIHSGSLPVELGALLFSARWLSSSLSTPPPPPPSIRRVSVMCSGAKHRNKAPCRVQSTWVNVRLGPEPQETRKKLSVAWRKEKRRLREREQLWDVE